MILFKQCEVYAPEKLGRRDVLVAGTRIVAVEPAIEPPAGVTVEVVGGDGLRMVPGLIDGHVHIAGAGGEGGPATRTPELRLSQLLDGGITTVIGSLGTDGFTRTVESVLMKAKALRAEGVSCWIFTGAYQVPTPTVLGDAGRDVALLDEVIGVGEVAISDHRSSGPSVPELIRLAVHARVGGMLGGKAGLVLLHMGDARDPFRPIYEAVAQSELPITQFLPTHCNRNDYIFEDAKVYARLGYVDLTASSFPFFPQYEIKPSKAIVQLLEAGVPAGHITLSSDACGSLPQFDAQGNLEKLVTGEPRSILAELVDAVRQEGLPLEQALGVATANVADIMKLPRKGRIRPGHDADLLLLDAEDRIHHLLALGEWLVRGTVPVKKDTFEN
jgi:beta-aspartyl-dipeptidase (metallo-type)